MPRMPAWSRCAAAERVRAAYSDVRAGGTLKPGSTATSPGT